MIIAACSWRCDSHWALCRAVQVALRWEPERRARVRTKVRRRLEFCAVLVRWRRQRLHVTVKKKLCENKGAVGLWSSRPRRTIDVVERPGFCRASQTKARSMSFHPAATNVDKSLCRASPPSRAGSAGEVGEDLWGPGLLTDEKGGGQIGIFYEEGPLVPES